MRKRELEILLEELKGFENPKIKLEQYVTPPGLAAFIATTAKLIGDLHTVFDLGCGTGILAISCSLLGAYSVGVELDLEALKIAEENADRVGAEIDLICMDVNDLRCREKVTTVMNPPFGIQRRNADRSFLKKALEISNVIYTIHSAGSEVFVRSMVSRHGFTITHLWKLSIPLRRSYSFHEKAFKYIPVEVFRIEKHESCNAGR
ncbi:METTL5 family protein [Archaeoglobus neptunius]|uniref:METTL5 family protein n=1 Tax=Archaeoglobus neptunius TaxID=2798580 RepID=UPI001928287B|nr:METTL5 family protein [Archaeoglobus neptunius]